LQSIGVPQSNAQELLNYLNTLPDTNRKRSAIQKIKSNPNISMEELQSQNSNKESEIVEYAKTIDGKYYKWIAKELSKFINSIVNWKKQVQYYKRQNTLEADEKFDRLIFQSEPITKTDFVSLSKSYDKHGFGVVRVIQRKHWRFIMDWVEQNNIDIMKYSFPEAEKESQKWHEELAERGEKYAKYYTNNIVYKFEDGWTIVELSPEDCETEGDLMGHCSSGYANSVRNNKTKIFSLRDPKNNPHVTIEGNYYTDNEKSAKASKTYFAIQQIQGKGNKEPIDEYKQRIKEWFDHIKTQNVHMSTNQDPAGDNITIENFTEYSDYTDEYGLELDFSSMGIGGSTIYYIANLQKAIDYGRYGRGGEINASRVSDIFDSLIDYAIKHHEIEEFDKAVDSFVEYADQNFEKYSIDIETESPYPNEEDYIIYPDTIEQQPEFTNNDFQKVKKNIFNQQQYDIDLEKYQTEYNKIINLYRQEDVVSRLSDYLVETWNKQKGLYEKRQAEYESQEQLALTGKNMKTLQKTATKKIPTAEELATYVEALNIHLKNNKVKDIEIKKVIESLPYPDSIRMKFSEQECKLIFDSIAYAWKKISGQDLFDETKISHAPKGLEGNYWMISGGIILEGPNHFTIVKRNLNLFATLLNISPFVLHEKIASPPDELIKTILDHGGMRLFITTSNKLYCQVNAETYSKWARKKVKGLDCKDKTVKVIDVSRPFKGWKTGITVKL